MPVARGRERLLGASPRCKLRLKRRFHRAPVDLSPLVGDLRNQCLLLRDLRLDALVPADQLGNVLSARSLGEARLLGNAFGESAALASRGQRKLRLIARTAGAFTLSRCRLRAHGPELVRERVLVGARSVGDVLLRCPDRSEAAISSITQQAHLRRGSVHSDWWFNHDILEGLADFGSVPQRKRPRSFDISSTPGRATC